MFCENCGCQIEEKDNVCHSCNTLINRSEDEGSAPSSGSERSPTIQTPGKQGNIVLSADEFVVREYRCIRFTKWLFINYYGYLTVTNRRVIFHAFHGVSPELWFLNSRAVIEMPLDSVSGISALYRYKILLIPLLIGLFSFFFVITGKGGSGYNPLFIIVGIMALYFCFRRTFVFEIFSSKGNNGPIDIGWAAILGAGGVLRTLNAKPTEQTDKMMLELGAMISDLQRLGDHGVEQWKIRIE